MAISRLTRVPLRELWKHEAHGFTRWLSENLDYLNEALKLELTLVEREASGDMSFYADILAEDADGNYFIIENQLEKTDHDHLGKIITYMSNFEGKGAIWITSEPHPEHEAAIHWLNELLPEDSAIYLVKLEAYKIDASASAPLFTIIAGPTKEGRQVGKEKKELAERHVLHLSFWAQLLERSKNRTSLFVNKSPGKNLWLSTGAGRTGFVFSYVIPMKSAQVELYIDTGNLEENKAYFDKLLARRKEIEERFGGSLEWQRLDNRRAARIRYVVDDRGLQNKESWPEIQDKLIDSMIRLSEALRPELKQL